MLNATHHGWAKKKIFHSRLPKTALNGIFTFSSCWKTSDLQKKNYIKEPIKKLFENTLNRIMQNCTFT